MILTVNQSFQLFQAEFSDQKISRTKFHENRPTIVELSDKLPHNMCVCQYHANFGFLLESLNKHIPVFPLNFGDLLEKLCCNVENEFCMSNDCNNCTKDIKDELVPLLYHSGLDEVTKWKQWRIIDNRMVLSFTEAPVADLIFELESQLPSFKLHTFVKRSQQKYFEENRKALEPND